MEKSTFQKAALAVVRQLNNLDEDTLQAIVDNEKYLVSILNNHLGSQLRREAYFAEDCDLHSIDEDEVQEALQEASYCDYSLMGELCRTELERNLVEMQRRLRNANADTDDYERRYRRAIND